MSEGNSSVKRASSLRKLGSFLNRKKSTTKLSAQVEEEAKPRIRNIKRQSLVIGKSIQAFAPLSGSEYLKTEPGKAINAYDKENDLRLSIDSKDGARRLHKRQSKRVSVANIFFDPTMASMTPTSSQEPNQQASKEQKSIKQQSDERKRRQLQDRQSMMLPSKKDWEAWEAEENVQPGGKRKSLSPPTTPAPVVASKASNKINDITNKPDEKDTTLKSKRDKSTTTVVDANKSKPLSKDSNDRDLALSNNANNADDQTEKMLEILSELSAKLGVPISSIEEAESLLEAIEEESSDEDEKVTKNEKTNERRRRTRT